MADTGSPGLCGPARGRIMRCAFIVALLLPLGLLSHEFAAAQPPKPGPPVQPPPAPVPIDKFVIRPGAGKIVRIKDEPP